MANQLTGKVIRKAFAIDAKGKRTPVTGKRIEIDMGGGRRFWIDLTDAFGCKSAPIMTGAIASGRRSDGSVLVIAPSAANVICLDVIPETIRGGQCCSPEKR